MTIQRLPSHVVEQIAAGEVLERPANLVKELVENSLDAGATEIEIDFTQGGRSVQIQDNGCGISAHDLPLALERHATSKITQADDLWNLNSYGFRGEALASIASVSSLTIVSREPDSSSGHRLHSEFGALSEVEPIGGKIGTLIQVRDLFENVPARLKFMKSEASETSQLKRTLKALAMGRPDVTFRVKQDGELIAFWPASRDMVHRCEQILETKPLFHAIGIENDLRVQITFAAPSLSQRSSQNIWMYVQGRWIQDKTLFAAVMDAYRSLLMHGNFPVAVVQVDCDPASVDVNIHPTKAQVKFRDGHRVFQAVHHTLRKAIEKAPWAPHTSAAKKAESRKDSESTISGGGSRVEAFPAEQPQLFLSSETLYKTKIESSSITMEDLRKAAEGLPEKSPSTISDIQADYIPAVEPSPFGALHHWAGLQVLGQANLTYVIAQSRKALVVVDQHAAHERVNFEKLMRAWREGQIEVQDYLLPISVEMEPNQVEALLGVQNQFHRLGLAFEQSGPNSIVVRSAPALLKDRAVTLALLLAANEVVQQGGSFAFEKIIGDVCASMACHSSIRAGQSLSHEEMKALLAQMDEFPLSGYCPHGRPVFVEHPFQQMDRTFGRIV